MGGDLLSLGCRLERLAGQAGEVLWRVLIERRRVPGMGQTPSRSVAGLKAMVAAV